MRMLLAAFIAGESLFLFLPSLPDSSWLLWGVGLSILMISLACWQSMRAKECLTYWQKLFLALVLCLVGVVWSWYLADQRQRHLLPEMYEGVDLLLVGVVDGLPKVNDEGVRFSLSLERIELEDQTKQIDLEKFPTRVSLGWYSGWNKSATIPTIQPGQRWKLPVRLKRPHGSMNPHGFDFERWMFAQDLGANGSVKSNTKGLYLSWRPQLLDDFVPSFNAFVELSRWHLRQKILEALPEGRYAGVLAALVMGDQNAIDQKDWRVFNATGIGHLISISGLHVTMLAGFGSMVAAWLWRRRSWPLICPVQKVAALGGLIVALVYTWLAGYQIPAQRTTYMVGVVAVAVWTGRTTRAFDIWWWALFLVMVQDPWAPYTPGFWLSFGAVAAILYAMPGAPFLSEYGHFQKPTWQESLREAVRVQAVVTIALLPLTFYWFAQASVVSPLANAVAIPVISYVVTPLAMLGSIAPSWAGVALLWLAHLAMEGVAWCLDPMANWSWSVVYQAQPSFWAMVLALIGLVWVIRPGEIVQSWRSRLCGLAACAGLFIPQTSGLDQGDYRMVVFDIGQGTAVLIETKNHRLLYDTGPKLSKLSDAGERSIVPYLRAEGISHINRLAISHKDTDHVGGALSVMRTIRIDDVLGTLPANHFLVREAKVLGIPALPCQALQEWQWDGVHFKVWHPDSETTFDPIYHQGKPNASSCVIEVHNKRHSVWLTGDVEIGGEALIADKYARDEQQQLILLVPHHGSATSSSEIFLDTLRPTWALVQAGYKNRYKHPVGRVVERYDARKIPLLQTVHTGAQIWESRAGQMSYRFWREVQKRFWHYRESSVQK